MHIWVDADACPVVRLVEQAAKRHNIPVTLLCDTNHVLASDYSEVIVIGAGADAVDFALVNRCGPGDLVVTQDYGVAAMALGKGAYGIHQSGKWYTQDNIGGLLMDRHLAQKARRASGKHHWKGPKKRTPSDDAHFAASLERLLEEVLGEENGMENRLSLYVPQLEDLWYRERLMSDPATMCYNKGYELKFAGYHRDTGCIDFPRTEWGAWYDYFIGKEPSRYYAYLVRKADAVWIGEVNFHQNLEQDWYEMGVVIEAEHRGCGYAVEALRLLEYQAFEVIGINMLHNDFETSRNAAYRAHLSAGFSEYRRTGGLIELTLTREQYFAAK